MSWTNELKAGDKVIVSDHPYEYIRTVERVTKTQVVINHSSSKFRISNGRLVGGSSWDRLLLIEPTPERIEKIIKKNIRNDLVKRFRKINTDHLSNVQLEKIIKVAK